MASPIYCILSGGTVHCIPVSTFNKHEEILDKMARTPSINSHPDASNCLQLQSPTSLAIKKKNLLYTLNNPSLSDLESDVSRTLSGGSHTQDDDEAIFDLNDEDIAPPVTSEDTKKSNIIQCNHYHKRQISDAPEEGKTEQRNKAFIMMDTEDEDFDQEALTLAILHDYSTHAVYLPQYFVDLKGNLDSNYTQIKTLLTKIFPSWAGSIEIKQLTGGITNMLLSCFHAETKETLLIRVYGQGTNLIIDRNREFVSHLVLNSLKLAPSIHARFANGLIYGFLPGRSFEPNELSNPLIYPLIAQQLGNWHSSINCEYIEDGVSTLRRYTASIKKRADPKLLLKPKPSKHEPKLHTKLNKSVNDIWDLIEDWIQIVPQNEALASSFRENTQGVNVTVQNIRDVVQKEFEWLKQTLKVATKSPVVVCHCDLLSGNVIVPTTYSADRLSSDDMALPPLKDNPIQFIDYEYMLPAPRAFDIANHFAEWQGFNCNRTAIPEPSLSNSVMVSWCKAYLNDLDAPSDIVSALIDEISCYYGMPGFYWGIWAMIQSELSTIDFNYAEYSKLRLEEYWLWKKKLQDS